MKELQIVPYEPKYHQDFKRLSMEWLENFDLLEDADLPILDHPQEEILDKGGSIFMGQYDNSVVGTVALKKRNTETIELLKLGVNSNYQGLGIGRKLMFHCIDLCAVRGVKKNILETNTKLVSAIILYKSLGFVEVPLTEVMYLTADYKMELELKNGSKIL